MKRQNVAKERVEAPARWRMLSITMTLLLCGWALFSLAPKSAGRQSDRKIRLLVARPTLIKEKNGKQVSGTLTAEAFLSRLLPELRKAEGFEIASMETENEADRVRQTAAENKYDFVLFTHILGSNDASVVGAMDQGVRKVASKIPVFGKKVETEKKFKVWAEYSLEAVAKKELNHAGKEENEDRQLEVAVGKVVELASKTVISKSREMLPSLPAPIAQAPNPQPAPPPKSGAAIRVVGDSVAEPRLIVQTAHSTMVMDYAYSPDGKLLATLSTDGIVKLWNTEKGFEVATFSGSRTVGIAFSPDGQTVAALGKDDVIRLYDARTGKPGNRLAEIIRTKPKRDKDSADIFNHPVSLAFGPAGKILVSGSENGVKIYDVTSGKWLRTVLKDEEATLVTISPDGVSVAAIVKENRVRVFSTADGKITHKFHSRVGKVTALVFSQNGQTLILGSRYGTVRLFDVAKEKESMQPPVYNKCEEPFEKIANTPEIILDNTPIESIASKINSACEISKDIKALWQKRWTIFYETSIRSLALSPNGNLLAWSYGDNTVRVNELASGKQIYELTPETKSLTSQLSAAMTGAAKDKPQPTGATGTTPATTPAATPATGTPATGAPAQGTPAGAPAQGAPNANQSKVAQVVAGLVVSEYFRQLAPVRFSTDGKYLNSIRQFKTIGRWEAATGKQVLSLALSNRDLSAGFPFPVPWGSVPVFGSGGDTLLTGSLSKGTKWWDLKTGISPQQITNSLAVGNKLPVSPDAKLMVEIAPVVKDPNAKDKGPKNEWKVVIRDVLSNAEAKSFTIQGRGAEPEFSPDNRYLALKTYEASGAFIFRVEAQWLRIYDLTNAQLVYSRKHASHFDFSRDGKLIVMRLDKDESFTMPFTSRKDEVRIVEVGTWQERQAFKPRAEDAESGSLASRVIFNSDATLVASTDNNIIKVWDARTGAEVAKKVLELETDLSNMVFHPTRKVLTFTTYRTLNHWDLDTGKVEVPPLLTDFWGNLMYSPDGNTLALGGAENRVRLFDVRDLRQVSEIGSLIVPTQNDWIVMTPEGRLDTSRLEQVREVHWILPTEPFESQPLELFMRDFYEPRLMARLVAGEIFPSLGDLTQRNRTLPEVAITQIAPDASGAGDLVNVTVQVKNAFSQKQFDAQKRQFQSGVHDLRLFRDGQLVGYADGSLLASGASEATRTFRVRLPHADDRKAFEFSAYAFNNERVKSLSVVRQYTPASPLAPQKGKVYLISMGVNASDNDRFTLRFAANDARQMQTQLASRLRAAGRYSAVIELPLISDSKPVNGKAENNATKATLKAVFDRLSGHIAQLPAEVVSRLPNAARLDRATPDDLILFSFAGHGYADKNGVFFLVPSDIGKDSPMGLAGVLSRCISSDELSAWLRDIDAADLLMIVDACHSAAAIEGKDFKPGPMGSRGLGQLSYDKGMQILAATQKNDYALEVDRLEQGLLTYALVADGIGSGAADHNPRDKQILTSEWLRYGVRRVPQLYQDVRSGKRSLMKDGQVVRSTLASELAAAPTGKLADVQQPQFFDFVWQRRDDLLVKVQ